jgi:DNA-binding MarR family transcriptional regulator
MPDTDFTSSLRTAVSSLHKLLRRQLADASSYSMTELETIGLIIKSGKILPTELAAKTKITTQSMSQILKKMDEQGIIKKTPSREDKRKVYISLTSSGKKMVEKIRYERDEWLRSVIEKMLSAREKEILAKALPVLNKLIQA